MTTICPCCGQAKPETPFLDTRQKIAGLLKYREELRRKYEEAVEFAPALQDAIRALDDRITLLRREVA